MNRYLTLIPIAFLLTGCFFKPYISNPELKRLSDSEIRAMFFAKTPIGTSDPAVKEFMKKNFRSEYKHLYTYSSADKFQRRSDFAVPVADGDYTMMATFGGYDWAKHLYLSGVSVMAVWLFDSEKKLKDILISRVTDSI